MESPKNHRGKPSERSAQVTRFTAMRHTNDCQVGRAVGGGRNPSAKRARGMGAVTALSQSANNGDWTARIMRKNPGVNRRMSVRFVDPATLAR